MFVFRKVDGSQQVRIDAAVSHETRSQYRAMPPPAAGTEEAVRSPVELLHGVHLAVVNHVAKVDVRIRDVPTRFFVKPEGPWRL